MERLNLDKISKQQENSSNDNIAYIDSNIVIINSVKDVIRKKDAVVIDGYLMLLVMKGHAIMTIEEEAIQLTAGDAFICTPRNIIENCMTSMDFELQGCFISASYTQQIMRNLNFNISFYGIRKDHKVAHLNKEEMEAMLAYHKLMVHIFKKPETELRNMAINNLMQICAIEFHSLFSKNDKSIPELPLGYTSAEQLVNRFAQILNNANPPIHSVNEVAAQLNITPKYFSTICKQITGHTASEIIIEQIVNTARIMLRSPQMSIKQIAIKLGFNNQSHFGTFMRRYTGKSPQQLRKQQNETFKAKEESI